MMITLHCFSYPATDDAHSVKIPVRAEDAQVVADQAVEERGLDRDQFGEWLRIRDAESGKLWDVRTAPCGEVCRCAAQAKAA